MDFDERSFEKASEQAQSEMDAAIQRHRAESERCGPGRETCLACGEPIPEQRRRVVAAVRCAPCQRDFEKRK